MVGLEPCEEISPGLPGATEDPACRASTGDPQTPQNFLPGDTSDAHFGQCNGRSVAWSGTEVLADKGEPHVRRTSCPALSRYDS